MDAKDFIPPVHFKELHLLPRVIFLIGAVCFIGAFFLKSFLIGFGGIVIVFAALTLNFATNFLTRISFKERTFPVAMLVQAIISFVIAYKLGMLLYYFYRQGEMPPFLQPISNTH